MTIYTVTYLGKVEIYEDWDEAFDAWMDYPEDATLEVIPDEDNYTKPTEAKVEYKHQSIY